jgi:hypothetical protein
MADADGIINAGLITRHNIEDMKGWGWQRIIPTI